jgi:hypothetical protein
VAANLKSVPLIPRERWWTKLAKMPARLWWMSGELATLLTDRAHRPPNKRRLAFIRLVVMAALILIAPFLLPFAFRSPRATAFDALHDRVLQVWQTSVSDAMSLLRTTFQDLVAQGAFGKMKGIEIPPFGTFGMGEAISVQQFLYRCEVTVGNHEEALAVAAALPGRVDFTILQQVDCLEALGRRADAIELLERNLDLDGWRGKLHKRLVQLGGRPVRIVR